MLRSAPSPLISASRMAEVLAVAEPIDVDLDVLALVCGDLVLGEDRVHRALGLAGTA